MIYDVIIIGSGPGGLTAGIYCPRYGLKTLIVEKMAAGGQMNLTEKIENYPGFDEPVNGYELSIKMENQAKKFGAEIEYGEVIDIELDGKIKKVITEDKTYEAKTILIATGAAPKKLNVPGEKEFTGKGVSYCGSCDAPMFKNKITAVVGGGDTALEEADIVSKHAAKVYLIHRRDKFRGQKILQDHIFNNPKIEIIWNTVVSEINGNEFVNSIRIKNLENGQESIIKIDGIFIFIGNIPNTEIFKGKIKLDKNGFIITDKTYRTSKEGVWACGDVIGKDLRQVAVAVGEGAQASFDIYKYINNL